MSWMERMILGGLILRAPEGDGGGGGGGGDKGSKGGEGDKGGSKDGDKGAAGTVTLTKEQFDAIMSRLPKEQKADDEGLDDKARKERESKEKEAANSKLMEKAISFTMGAKDWLKTNEAILPKTVPGIFEAAEKENYGNAIEKANAIKVGVVQEFFAQQANLDLLTDSQKSALADFKALTKNEKSERVQGIYESVFEPAFESLKRERKAAQLRNGQTDPTDRQSAHLAKMQQVSRKYYLKEKGNQ